MANHIQRRLVGNLIQGVGLWRRYGLEKVEDRG